MQAIMQVAPAVVYQVVLTYEYRSGTGTYEVVVDATGEQSLARQISHFVNTGRTKGIVKVVARAVCGGEVISEAECVPAAGGPLPQLRVYFEPPALPAGSQDSGFVPGPIHGPYPMQ